jgi:hypothetical protein
VDDLLIDFLEELFHNAPTFVALAAGVLVAVALLHKYPAPALRAILGFAWLFAAAVASLAWRTVLVAEFFPDAPFSLEERLSYLGLSALEGIGYLILLSAVFVGREDRRARHFREDPHDDF